MRLGLAIKAFFKAFKDPKQAQQFVLGITETKVKEKETVDHEHLRLLASLQQSGRLIDFLKEDITGFSDAQVGAAVRKIHADCSKTLEDLVTIRSVLSENEGASISVPNGYDPSEIKVVGKVKGQPPFKGILRHKGWKAHKISLPKQTGDHKREVLCPAEIEVI